MLPPRDSQFMWFSPDFSIASRLDTFLVPRGFISSVLSCDIAPCVFSAHDFVFLSLALSNSPRVGPEVWKITVTTDRRQFILFYLFHFSFFFVFYFHFCVLVRTSGHMTIM